MKVKMIFIISLLILQSLNANNKNRQGWFSGLGIGIASSKSTYSREYSLFIPWEIGYGVNENTLIHFSVETSTRLEGPIIVFESLSGLGLSYYMNNDNYIKTIIGSSRLAYLSIFGEGEVSGSGFSIGYGDTLSKKSSIELTYLGLFFDKIQKTSTDISYSTNTISITYKYRWF